MIFYRTISNTSDLTRLKNVYFFKDMYVRKLILGFYTN